MEESRKNVNIYTDGACSGNPGPGGWAAILEFGAHRKELSGYMAGTTNNRMELFAAISGLAFNAHWIDKWMKNGWKTSDGGKVENQDLWFILTAQTKKHHVEFIKVKGHADHPENNRCDELARAAIEEYREKYESETDSSV